MKMEIPWQVTLHQRSMIYKVAEVIRHIHKAQGPQIMALQLQDMYWWLGFSPKAVKFLVREQVLDSPAKSSHRQEC